MARSGQSIFKRFISSLRNIGRSSSQPRQTTGKEVGYLQRATQKLRELGKKAFGRSISKNESKNAFRNGQKSKSESKNVFKSEKTREDLRKEELGRSLLRGKRGNAFFAATKNIWYKNGDVSSYDARLDLIKEELGVSNTLDAIVKLGELFDTDFLNSEYLSEEGFFERYNLLVRYGLLYF